MDTTIAIVAILCAGDLTNHLNFFLLYCNGLAARACSKFNTLKKMPSCSQEVTENWGPYHFTFDNARKPKCPFMTKIGLWRSLIRMPNFGEGKAEYIFWILIQCSLVEALDILEECI